MYSRNLVRAREELDALEGMISGTEQFEQQLVTVLTRIVIELERLQ